MKDIFVEKPLTKGERGNILLIILLQFRANFALLQAKSCTEFFQNIGKRFDYRAYFMIICKHNSKKGSKFMKNYEEMKNFVKKSNGIITSKELEEKTIEETIENAKKQIEEKQYETTLMEKGFSNITKIVFAFKGKNVKMEVY